MTRTNDSTLYRVDSRGPSEIFPDGFQPRDMNGSYDLNVHVGENTPSPFVSTSYSTETINMGKPGE